MPRPKSIYRNAPRHVPVTDYNSARLLCEAGNEEGAPPCEGFNSPSRFGACYRCGALRCHEHDLDPSEWLACGNCGWKNRRDDHIIVLDHIVLAFTYKRNY